MGYDEYLLNDGRVFTDWEGLGGDISIDGYRFVNIDFDKGHNHLKFRV